jgi:hypothetical protein
MSCISSRWAMRGSPATGGWPPAPWRCVRPRRPRCAGSSRTVSALAMTAKQEFRDLRRHERLSGEAYRSTGSRRTLAIRFVPMFDEDGQRARRVFRQMAFAVNPVLNAGQPSLIAGPSIIARGPEEQPPLPARLHLAVAGARGSATRTACARNRSRRPALSHDRFRRDRRSSAFRVIGWDRPKASDHCPVVMDARASRYLQQRQPCRSWRLASNWRRARARLAKSASKIAVQGVTMARRYAIYDVFTDTRFSPVTRWRSFSTPTISTTSTMQRGRPGNEPVRDRLRPAAGPMPAHMLRA